MPAVAADPAAPVVEPSRPTAASVVPLAAVAPAEPAEAPQQKSPGAGLSRAMRTQGMVLGFYLLDALFMAAFAANGTLPAWASIGFGAAGGGLTAMFTVAMRLGLHRRMGGANFTTLQLLSACGLMLVWAAVVPQIGLLLLMTMMVAVATAALQMTLHRVVAVSGLVATCSLILFALKGPEFGVPLQDGWSRLMSGVWFALVLGKIAAINLIGAQMRKALATSNERLAQALAQVRELSERDELTGLQNRRSILAMLKEERARFARGGMAFGVAILDIDHFKQVNDRFGHAKGDEVLRVFAKIVGGQLRGTDRLARLGGEEFLLVLPNTPDLQATELTAERLRRAVADHPWSELAAGLAITCSIGLTTSRLGEDTPEMLERADAALYRAKSEGRNAVRMA